jgi:Ser/Thr protein kinase RdoA (MazF antagonist)
VEEEPELDRGRVLRGVQDVYGVEAEAIRFVPVGYATACYVVAARGTPAWFLKLFPDTGVTASVIDRQPAVVRLLGHLGTSLRTARVAAPIRTRRGELMGTIEGLPAVLFGYVPGTAPADDDKGVWLTSAAFLAELHNTACPPEAALPHDRFDTGVCEVLRSALGDVDSFTHDDVSTQLALRRLVLSRRDDILVQLERLHDLGRDLSTGTYREVICHTDFGGDNLLISTDGEMTVLDWDGATMAAPEHDLWIASQTDTDAFLSAYRAAAGVADLQERRFEFYLLRRYLEDMTARLTNVLYESPRPPEIAEALDGMARWGWDQWDTLDHTLGRVVAAIR